jgi:hypothetical protein
MSSLAFVQKAMDQRVHWLSRFQDLRRDFAAANRKRPVEETDLEKH